MTARCTCPTRPAVGAPHTPACPIADLRSAAIQRAAEVLADIRESLAGQAKRSA